MSVDDSIKTKYKFLQHYSKFIISSSKSRFTNLMTKKNKAKYFKYFHH